MTHRSAGRTARRWFLAAALPAVAWANGGCVTRITESPAESAAECGPFPTDYVGITRRWFEGKVKVIAVLQEFRAEPPVAGSSEFGFVGWGKVQRGWRTTVVGSGTDAIGMSTGQIAYAVLIRDGEVVADQKLMR